MAESVRMFFARYFGAVSNGKLRGGTGRQSDRNNRIKMQIGYACVYFMC